MNEDMRAELMKDKVSLDNPNDFDECYHDSLSAENERIREHEYRAYVVLEYDVRCEKCGRIVDTERVRYKKEN